MILVDTNVLGRFCHTNDPLRRTALDAIRYCLRRRELVVIVPQTLYEFWVTATRPANVNGLEMPFDRAMRWIEHFRRTFAVFPDPPELLEQWEKVIRGGRVLGKRAHDARLVAAMKLHGIETILTFNAAHFEGLGVKVVDPANMKA